MILHIVLFIAIALLWAQSSPQGIVANETPREVGIIISQNPNANKTEYFQATELPNATLDSQNNQEASSCLLYTSPSPRDA